MKPSTIHRRRPLAMRRRPPSRRAAQRGIGIRVSAMRRSRGWSQNDLARRCRVTRGLVGQMERGTLNFSLRTLLPIAKGLETTVAELFVGIA
jgi:transcriptional regulator with XRE-family HTH domain